MSPLFRFILVLFTCFSASMSQGLFTSPKAKAEIKVFDVKDCAEFKDDSLITACRASFPPSGHFENQNDYLTVKEDDAVPKSLSKIGGFSSRKTSITDVDRCQHISDSATIPDCIASVRMSGFFDYDEDRILAARLRAADEDRALSEIPEIEFRRSVFHQGGKIRWAGGFLLLSFGAAAADWLYVLNAKTPRMQVAQTLGMVSAGCIGAAGGFLLSVDF